MALQDAILVALANGESSGYDLAKSFDVTVANYWTATAQQLYRELDKMAADGLVSARVVEQQRRPNKRVFALTDAGRAALRAATARPPKPTAIRDELLVQVEAIDHGDAAAIRSAVLAKRDASQAKLARYERRRATMLGGRDEAAYLTAGQRIGPYLTLARGIAFEEENIRWCDWVLSLTIPS
ncbi:MAG: PadR family transcriptional regulator [Tetrasphaera sp.]